MIAADRPKTPRRALKKPMPSSVARTTPIARRTENGAALICALLEGPGSPLGIRASASASLPTARISRNDYLRSTFDLRSVKACVCGHLFTATG